MRRRSFTAMSLGLVGACAVGCGRRPSGDTTSGPVPAPRPVGSLTLWAPRPLTAALTAAGRRFAQDHPGSSVHVVASSRAAIEAGLRGERRLDADLVWVPHDLLEVMSRHGTVAALSLTNLFSACNPLAVGAFTQAGQTYALPCGVSNLALVRNRAATGTVPATWDDLVGSQVSPRGTGPVLQGLADDGAAFGLFGWQTSFGNTGFTVGRDGTLESNPTLGDDAGQGFATWLFAQGRAGRGLLNAELTDQAAAALFRKGAAPFLITDEATARALRSAGMELDVLAIPSAGGQEARPFLQVQGLALLSTCAVPDVAEAFLREQLGSVRAQAALATAAGYAPALADAMKAPRVEGDQLTMGFARAGSNGIPTPSLVSMPEIWRLWSAAEVRILAGAAPEPTWVAMANRVNQLVSGDPG